MSLKGSLWLLRSILILELVGSSKHVVELLLHVHVLVAHAHVIDHHLVGVLERCKPRLIKHIIQRCLSVPIALVKDLIIGEGSVLRQNHGADESTRALSSDHLVLAGHLVVD